MAVSSCVFVRSLMLFKVKAPKTLTTPKNTVVAAYTTSKKKLNNFFEKVQTLIYEFWGKLSPYF